MEIARYFTYFVIFSFLGWIYECIVMSIYHRKWCNRGFLFGPVCPIYGFGAVGGTLLFTYILSPSLAPWKMFLLFSVGTAILEYSTSYILERWFHARWWDYSSAPLNLHGRICLPASVGFGLFGIFFVYILLPQIHKVDLFTLEHPYALETISLMLMLLLALDIAFTLSALTDLVSRMENAQAVFDGIMDDGFNRLQEGPNVLAESVKTKVADVSHSVAGMRQTVTDRIKNLPGELNAVQKKQIASIRAFTFGKESRVLNGLNKLFGRHSHPQGIVSAGKDKHTDE